jgi:single-stranded DNA-binding protein
MTEHVMENNCVRVAGKMHTPLKYSHEMYGEGFYIFELAVSRLSGYIDILPVTVSERLLGEFDIHKGNEVVIEGQLRSYNKFIDGSNRLVLTIFARNISLLQEMIRNPNQIVLNGFICKKPIYRTTPFNREITDILLAVNRPYNKSDYIPLIAWGRNAKFSEKLEIGDQIKIWGRIQSRPYQKRFASGEVVEKVAYEVSISKMEVVEGEEEVKREPGTQ